MQTALVQHYTAEFIDIFLAMLATKFPFQPIGGILHNYLYLSNDGSDNSRLKVFAAELYDKIKTLEALPDEAAYSEEAECKLTKT